MSFNLPLNLMLYQQEWNYIDNLWANNRHPSFPEILTQFCDYLHSKNLKSQMSDPSLRPKSIDAFLDLQQTNQILASKVSDLQQQLDTLKKNWEKEKIEKEILKKRTGKRSRNERRRI